MYFYTTVYSTLYSAGLASYRRRLSEKISHERREESYSSLSVMGRHVDMVVGGRKSCLNRITALENTKEHLEWCNEFVLPFE